MFQPRAAGTGPAGIVANALRLRTAHGFRLIAAMIFGIVDD
ncbi:hypothetical protein [Paralimibaculum aggregatum]|nr:hypothetical protein [Limibaculum sp. NKW23]